MAKLAIAIALNGMVFGGAGLIARFGLQMRDRLAWLVSSLLVGWLCILVGLEALGLFGQIHCFAAAWLASGGTGSMTSTFRGDSTVPA